MNRIAAAGWRKAAIHPASLADSSREAPHGAPGLTMFTCAKTGANVPVGRAASRLDRRTE